MIWSLLIFGCGAYCGHVLSPTIDGWMADLELWWDPDISDERNIDRNDWSTRDDHR